MSVTAAPRKRRKGVDMWSHTQPHPVHVTPQPTGHEQQPPLLSFFIAMHALPHPIPTTESSATAAEADGEERQQRDELPLREQLRQHLLLRALERFLHLSERCRHLGERVGGAEGLGEGAEGRARRRHDGREVGVERAERRRLLADGGRRVGEGGGDGAAGVVGGRLDIVERGSHRRQVAARESDGAAILVDRVVERAYVDEGVVDEAGDAVDRVAEGGDVVRRRLELGAERLERALRRARRVLDAGGDGGAAERGDADRGEEADAPQPAARGRRALPRARRRVGAAAPARRRAAPVGAAARIHSGKKERTTRPATAANGIAAFATSLPYAVAAVESSSVAAVSSPSSDVVKSATAEDMAAPSDLLARRVGERRRGGVGGGRERGAEGGEVGAEGGEVRHENCERAHREERRCDGLPPLLLGNKSHVISQGVASSPAHQVRQSVQTADVATRSVPRRCEGEAAARAADIVCVTAQCAYPHALTRPTALRASRAQFAGESDPRHVTSLRR